MEIFEEVGTNHLYKLKSLYIQDNNFTFKLSFSYLPNINCYLTTMKYSSQFLCSLILFAILSTFACEQKTTDKNQSSITITKPNPAAEGFDAENSDLKAIAIADEVMEAMGGRKAYDETRYLSWNFFGSRKHWWDKKTGDIRIESQREDFKVKMNINDMTGEVWKDGQLMSQADSLAKYLKRAKGMWINDSYWLVMPFKLKDSGVTLGYMGEEKSDSLQADILELRFRDVGITPENKYWVYVDKKDRLVNQWSFYGNAKDEEPRFVMPWKDYNKYGLILLSGDRGKPKLSEISVDASIADKLKDPIN